MTAAWVAASPIPATLGWVARALGCVLVAEVRDQIVAVSFGDHLDALYRSFEREFPDLFARRTAWTAGLGAAMRWFERPAERPNARLQLRGTDFQRAVWRALRDVPAGSTTSYADIARSIGRPNAARAVARACRANAIALFVPCHRVIGQGGLLCGYRWGIERKQALLRYEGALLRWSLVPVRLCSKASRPPKRMRCSMRLRASVMWLRFVTCRRKEGFACRSR